MPHLHTIIFLVGTHIQEQGNCNCPESPGICILFSVKLRYNQGPNFYRLERDDARKRVRICADLNQG